MEPPRRSARLLALVPLLLVLHACTYSPTDPYRKELRRLQAHRELWERQKVRDYAYTVTRTCFCAPEMAGPVEVEVRGGRTVSARYVSSGEPAEPQHFGSLDDVYDLFDTISRGLDEEPDEATIAYDARLGHPLSAHFDHDRYAKDEESGFRVESFRVLPAQ